MEIRTEFYQLEEKWPLDQPHAIALPIFKPFLGLKQTGWPARQIPVLLIPKDLEAALHINHKSDKIVQVFLLKGKSSLTARNWKRHTVRLQSMWLQLAHGHTSPCSQLQTTKTEPKLCLLKKSVRRDFATSTVIALGWKELYSVLHQIEHKAKGFHRRSFLYWQV